MAEAWEIHGRTESGKGEPDPAWVQYTGQGSDREGICGWYINGFNRVLQGGNSRALSLVYLLVTALQMIPLISFYLLDEPHDCFVCLGKDPDRIYSNFQLTKL